MFEHSGLEIVAQIFEVFIGNFSFDVLNGVSFLLTPPCDVVVWQLHIQVPKFLVVLVTVNHRNQTFSESSSFLYCSQNAHVTPIEKSGCPYLAFLFLLFYFGICFIYLAKIFY